MAIERQRKIFFKNLHGAIWKKGKDEVISFILQEEVSHKFVKGLVVLGTKMLYSAFKRCSSASFTYPSGFN